MTFQTLALRQKGLLPKGLTLEISKFEPSENISYQISVKFGEFITAKEFEGH